MRGRRDGGDVGGGPAAGGDRLRDGFRRRPPEPIHVALDMARPRDRLRDPPARDRKLRAIRIENDGLGDGQSAIDPEKARHGARSY